MTYLGTRPPTVDEYEQYQLHHMGRLSSKPGITGLWQVSGRSDMTDLYETKLDWITERNKNLIRPTHRPKERDYFYSDIKKLGYKKWARRYFYSEAFLRNVPVFSQMIRIKHKLQRKGENV